MRKSATMTPAIMKTSCTRRGITSVNSSLIVSTSLVIRETRRPDGVAVEKAQAEPQGVVEEPRADLPHDRLAEEGLEVDLGKGEGVHGGERSQKHPCRPRKPVRVRPPQRAHGLPRQLLQVCLRDRGEGSPRVEDGRPARDDRRGRPAFLRY